MAEGVKMTIEERTRITCEKHSEVKSPLLCPICLVEERDNLRIAVKGLIAAWNKPNTERSLYQLKTDMDEAVIMGE